MKSKGSSRYETSNPMDTNKSNNSKAILLKQSLSKSNVQITGSPTTPLIKKELTSPSPSMPRSQFKINLIESTDRTKGDEDKQTEGKDFSVLYNKIFGTLPSIRSPKSFYDKQSSLQNIQNPVQKLDFNSPTKEAISAVKKYRKVYKPKSQTNMFKQINDKIKEGDPEKEANNDISTGGVPPVNKAADNNTQVDPTSRYRFSKGDSKYDEIQMLRRQISKLQEENSKLKEDLKQIDEFRIAIESKTSVENFNEKRCDILKAQIRKQQRYIDHLTTTLKLTKKFYKDTVSIMEFLIEINNKYMKADNIKNENLMVYLKEKEAETKKNSYMQSIDAATLSMNEIYRACSGNIEILKKFLDNFNECYDKVKSVYLKNEEVKGIFDITMAALRHINPSKKRISNELQRKIKYNYLLGGFIKQYKRYFPIYSVFNEFDGKDKNDFGLFLNQLVKLSTKVDEVIKKVNNFQMLRHNKFVFASDLNEFLLENMPELDEYFDKTNAKKKIYLNGEELLECEKRLSKLLNELISFHKLLIIDRNGITVDQVFNLSEELRFNIENLLCLGLSINPDLIKNKQSIIITNKLGRVDEVKDIPMQGSGTTTLDKLGQYKVLTYQIENENNRDFPEYSEKIQKYIYKLVYLLDSLKGISSGAEQIGDKKNIMIEFRDSVQQLDHLFNIVLISNKEQVLINQIKELELRYLREYAALIASDSKRLNKLIMTKNEEINNLLLILMTEMKNMLASYEECESDDFRDQDSLSKFQNIFKSCAKNIMDHLNKIMNPNTNILYAEMQELDNFYKQEYQKIEEDLHYYSQRLMNIIIQVKQCLSIYS